MAGDEVKDLSDWRRAVMARDRHQCRMAGMADLTCRGPLAAHHVIFRSRSTSRRADPDNGASLCRAHHDWVHAHPADARDLGFAARAGDEVRDGRRPSDNTIAALAALVKIKTKETP